VLWPGLRVGRRAVAADTVHMVLSLASQGIRVGRFFWSAFRIKISHWNTVAAAAADRRNCRITTTRLAIYSFRPRPRYDDDDGAAPNSAFLFSLQQS
jgi:hypothetical protein